ncbi:MAG: hypothetical protein WCP20_05270 [Desulfuromonadales bacterium]
MIENEIAKLQILGTLKLLLSAYLFFFWIPKRVFPQEYINSRLDQVIFNIIHMVAIITLVFPLFIYAKVFDFLFLSIFFVGTKLLFVKFYYKKPVIQYFRSMYHKTIIGTMRFIEQPGIYIKSLKDDLTSRFAQIRAGFHTANILFFGTFLTIFFYGLYLRMYRSFTSLIAPLVDMYQFYLWNNILRDNVLFSKAAGAPYMWGGSVLVYTVNLLMSLNTVLLYNLFPILFLSFIFFSILYFIRSLADLEEEKTGAMLLGILLFAVILPSPICSEFFGYFYKSSSPEIHHIGPFTYYFSSNLLPNQIDDFSPFIYYWRSTTTLPYELAASFFLANLAFLLKFIKTKNYIYMLLYGETLAIVFSIHGGGAIPAALALVLIGLYSLIIGALDRENIIKGFITVALATLFGNLWMLQFFIFGIPQDIGLAAPFLDKIFKTNRTTIDIAKRGIYDIMLIAPTNLLFVLGSIPIFLFLVSIFTKKLRFHLVSTGLIIISILFICFAANLGLPTIVSPQRSQVYLAYGYIIGFSVIYYIVIEKWFLKTLFKKSYFGLSAFLMLLLSVAAIFLTPRWIDNEMYRNNKTAFEYTESPYLLYKIEDTFQPFTYTVVCHTIQFHQLSKGWHMNIQDFLKEYNPLETSLRVPTEFVFVFVEKIPFNSQAMLYEDFDIWNRWRPDLIDKIKDWVFEYSGRHDNIKLWYQNSNVSVYLIDNRAYQDFLYKNSLKTKDTGR